MLDLAIETEALITAVLIGAAVLTVFIGVYAAVYARGSKKTADLTGAGAGDGWLFSNFYLTAYRAFFGDTDPDIAAMRLGIDAEEHRRNCAVLHREPEMEKMAVHRIYGIAILAACVFAWVLTGSYVFLIPGAGGFIYFFMYERMRVQSEAERMRLQVAEELPGFLDLLQPEIEAGIPIENAIRLICDHTDTLIAREFKAAFNEMEIGAGDWKEAVTRTADKYDVDTLNSFVLAVVSAYDKGISVEDTVRREAKEIRSEYLLDKKSNAQKTQNTVLVPIIIFQMMPLIIFLLMPSMAAIMEDDFL